MQLFLMKSLLCVRMTIQRGVLMMIERRDESAFEGLYILLETSLQRQSSQRGTAVMIDWKHVDLWWVARGIRPLA